MSKEPKKEYKFITEQIKQKPFYKKKWFFRSGAAIGLALLFGAVAGLVFAIITPWAQKTFGAAEAPRPIVIAQETEHETESAAKETVAKQTETKQTETQKPVKETVIEKKELKIADYKKLYSMMHDVASQAAKSVVTVAGINNDVDWFNDVYESQVQASGMVVANNGTDLFVLTQKSVIDGANRIVVTLPNGEMVDAQLQKHDTSSGLAIVKIPLQSLSQAARDSIVVADLGSSSSVLQGAPVIAIGSPLGYSNSMVFGMATSIMPMSGVDREYRLITTDIIGRKNGSGIIVNLDGKIVGILKQDEKGENTQTTLNGYAISEIKKLIECLSNNTDMAYLGIKGKEVTESVEKSRSIPKGIYISEVEPDSPAMYAGVLPGDIMVSLNGKDTFSMQSFIDQLHTFKPGQQIEMVVMRGSAANYERKPSTVTLGSTP